MEAVKSVITKILNLMFVKVKKKEVFVINEENLNNGEKKKYFSNGVTQTIIKGGRGIEFTIPELSNKKLKKIRRRLRYEILRNKLKLLFGICS